MHWAAPIGAAPVCSPIADRSPPLVTRASSSPCLLVIGAWSSSVRASEILHPTSDIDGFIPSAFILHPFADGRLLTTPPWVSSMEL